MACVTCHAEFTAQVVARAGRQPSAMDAINALAGATQQAQASFDGAARELARADLPTTAMPDMRAPAAVRPNNNVDPAEQLTTMIMAADTHRITTSALRMALDAYQDLVRILPR